MTTKQIKYVRGLLRSADLEEEKDSLVLQYTDGRTTHLTDMNQADTQALIKALGGGVSPRTKMVNKMLSLAHEMGWELPESRKVNMERINAWCNKYTKHKCDLDDIPNSELGAVVTNFEKIYEDFLKTL